MPRVTIAAQNISTELTTALTALTLTAADPANDEQTVWTDGLHIIAQNSHASTTYNIIISTPADALGRTISGGLTQAITAGSIYISKEIPADGFRQSDGYVYFEADNAAVKWAVIKTR